MEQAREGQESQGKPNSGSDPAGAERVVSERPRANVVQDGEGDDRARLPRAVPASDWKRANPAVSPLRHGTGLTRTYGAEVPGLEKKAGRVTSRIKRRRPFPPFHREGDDREQGEVGGLLAIL